MQRKEINTKDRRTKYTRSVIREALMGLLRIKPYSKITVTESFSDVSQTIGHVLCPQKETCTYPFCQKVQENKALWPLFMDETVSERIIKQLAGKSKEGFVSYLMQHSDLTFEQAESIFYFQIHGCLTINRLMLQNNCRDWHNVQQTIDRFIRAGLQEFLQDGE